MNTLFILLAKYNSPRLNLEQIADFMNVSVQTVQNRIYAKTLPFPVYKEGNGHFADLSAVAAYMDDRRLMAAQAHAAVAQSLL